MSAISLKLTSMNPFFFKSLDIKEVSEKFNLQPNVWNDIFIMSKYKNNSIIKIRL